MRDIRKSTSVLVLSFLFAFGAARALPAQTLSAGAQLSGVASNGALNYTLTLSNSNASTASIETFWFGWVPGADFMPVSPTNVGTPAGWTDQITHGGAGDGYAIQFVTSTAALAPGGSLTFTFTSTSSPATMAGDSPYYSTTPIGSSFVYSGPPESGASDQFVVETTTGSSSNPTNLVSLSFTNVAQVCKTKVKIDKKTETTNSTTTCKLSLQLVIANLGVASSPAFDVLVWAGQGSNFDSSAGLSPATEKIKALKISKVGAIKLKDTFDGSQSGLFIYCTDTGTNVITSTQIE